MGLTIHYSLRSSARTQSEAGKQVEAMRQLALDLPFEAVGDVIQLGRRELKAIEATRGPNPSPLLWFAIQSGCYVDLSGGRSVRVEPSIVEGFAVEVGPGCEPMNLGLCRYPATVTVDHRRYPVNRPGYSWDSFCKTQYASDPECGGAANFVRCHVSAITLLERIGEIPGLTVTVRDEGHYGPSHHSDDYREAYAAGRKPTYVDHPATHSIPKLLAECGDYNEMIAALAGALSDRMGADTVESPIKSYPNFERLEFDGHQDPRLASMLGALKNL